MSTRYKKYELFLSSTPAVPSTLLIRQFECSNDMEPGVAESGSSGTNDLADFLLSDEATDSAMGTVEVVNSSGTFTVYNQVGTPRNVSFDLRWTAGPLHKTSTVTRADVFGVGHVLLDAKFSSAAATVTGVIDGWPISNCCYAISTVP